MTIMTKNAQVAASWSVAAAKAKLSDVLERAHTDGPQRITRRGERPVIVVPEEQWNAVNQPQGTIPIGKGTIVEFFKQSPMYGSGVVFGGALGAYSHFRFDEDDEED